MFMRGLCLAVSCGTHSANAGFTTRTPVKDVQNMSLTIEHSDYMAMLRSCGLDSTNTVFLAGASKAIESGKKIAIKQTEDHSRPLLVFDKIEDFALWLGDGQLPCKQCGLWMMPSNTKLKTTAPAGTSSPKCLIQCDCGARTELLDSADEATEAWNRMNSSGQTAFAGMAHSEMTQGRPGS